MSYSHDVARKQKGDAKLKTPGKNQAYHSSTTGKIPLDNFRLKMTAMKIAGYGFSVFSQLCDFGECSARIFRKNDRPHGHLIAVVKTPGKFSSLKRTRTEGSLTWKFAKVTLVSVTSRYQLTCRKRLEAFAEFSEMDSRENLYVGRYFVYP